MVRNLKDTLVSLHNFRGAAIDGMLRNNLGPGLFERFVDVDGCPDTMGSAFLWVCRNAKACATSGWAGPWWCTTSGVYATLRGRYVL